MRLSSFRDLRVWQMAMDLVEETYGLTGAFPAHERYGLTSQMRRAAVSIPSNIAEGYARRHRGEYVQHLAISEGSLAELETQFEIASRLGYISSEALGSFRPKAMSLGKQLYALRRSLTPKP
jgi:four helix bundle protein